MWDRWAILAVAALVAARAAKRGWRFGTGGDWLAAAGMWILAFCAVGAPLILVALGPGTGR